MFRVGLTGGIASGKSAAASDFANLGAQVIDTDLIAREVVAPGQPGLDSIAEQFGTEVLLADGALDRRKLRELVFNAPERRVWLEQLLHPLIRAATLEQASVLTGPYQILVVPLLVETGFADLVDRVLVIDCPENIQLERLLARDSIDEITARQMVNAQVSRQDRLAAADDVILNAGSRAELELAVAEIHGRYLQLVSA